PTITTLPLSPAVTPARNIGWSSKITTLFMSSLIPCPPWGDDPPRPPDSLRSCFLYLQPHLSTLPGRGPDRRLPAVALHTSDDGPPHPHPVLPNLAEVETPAAPP